MTASTTVELSLTRGGPFDALLRRLHLSRHDRRDRGRQAFVLAAVAWLPMAIAAAVEWSMGRAPSTLMGAASVHVRLLVAIPLFIAAEHSLEQRCRRTIDRFLEEGFAVDEGAAAGVVESARRWRDALWPELVLAGTALVLGQLTFWGIIGSAGMIGEAAAGGPELSVARVWYAFVALPLFQFLLARTLWHWVLWACVLWRFSRLRLRLTPTHPDRAAGIGFLTDPARSLAIAVLAVSVVLAVTWSGGLLEGHVGLKALVPPFAMYVALAELIALAPLLCMAGPLSRARSDGLRQYGALALRYTRSFHERWIDRGPQAPPADALLGSADIQSLADTANSHAIVEGTRSVLVGRRTLVMVFLAAFLPMLPLVATEVPFPELLKAIGRALLGDLPR